jgi:electron transfer flavoprotein beta subunit
MQIVACIKQVPDTTQVQIDPVTNTLVREGIPFIVNPYDTHAVEESLRLRDRFGFTVTAISMGPLSDRVFGGADTLATSNVLTEAIRTLNETEEVGIIFCGKQTIDGDTAQVGPGIATRLGCTQLTLVDKILELDLDKRRIKVSRKLEGRHEIVEAPLPVMITVVRELNRPRYPTVPGRLASMEKKIELWNNQTLKLDEQQIGLKGSPTWVSKIFSPERDKGEMIGDGVGDPVGTAHLLIDKLLSKDLLAI